MFVETRKAHLFLLSILVTFAGVLGWINGLGRADQLIYDRALTLLERPASKDVLIITIDDEAIDSLGRWPWPRSLHAKLLERLQDAKAVGLNIVFSETDADRADEDQLLANAIRQHGRVVLPIVLNSTKDASRAILPIASLAEAAKDLGYINIDVDDDGVLRRTTWKAGTDALPWHHFALSMLNVGGDATKVDDFLKHIPTGSDTLIPYAGKPGHFRKVSYLSVLRGEVPAHAIKDKYVLIGTWATGLGNVFPSPVSHHVSGISGVEVVANMLHAAKQNIIFTTAAPWQTALTSALAVLLLCLTLPKLSPRQAIFFSLFLIALLLASTVLLLHVSGLWIPPGAAIIGIIVSYPLWSWRSQEAALRYMSRELKQLRVEYPPLLDIGMLPDNHRTARSLDQQIADLNYTLAYARQLRRFVAEGLDGIPDVTMVIDTSGRVRYRNRAAIAYFLHLGIRPPRVGEEFLPALDQAIPLPNSRNAIHSALDVDSQELIIRSNTNRASSTARPLTIDVRDRAEQDLLIRISHTRTATGTYAGTVLNISDVSAIRRAERQREKMMQFISHDMRSPQNSILALIELNRQKAHDESSVDMALTRIEHFANQTLDLVDDFIQLTRAESMHIAHERVDLVAIVHELADDFWAITQPCGVTLYVESSTPIALSCGDSPLIRRAISNLIENAIKYSPENTTIHIRIAAKNNTWCIEVEDHGYGISVEEQQHLFEPFFRTKSVRSSNTTGSGLGLAFVYTVAQRHGGNVNVYSELGIGSRFTFCLPFIAEDDES